MLHSSPISLGAPKRMIRVGESFFRVSNYKLAFQKFFGKKISNGEQVSSRNRAYEKRKALELQKFGKPASNPEVIVDHEQSAGYFPKLAKAAWYGKRKAVARS